MGVREITDGDLMVCRSKACQKVDTLIKQVEGGLNDYLERRPNTSLEEILSLRFQAYETHYENARIILRRNAEIFYPKLEINLETEESFVETFEMRRGNCAKDLKLSLLAAFQAHFMMEAWLEKMRLNPLTRINGTQFSFNQCAEGFKVEESWVELAREIFMQDRTPADCTARVSERRFPQMVVVC